MDIIYALFLMHQTLYQAGQQSIVLDFHYNRGSSHLLEAARQKVLS